MYPQQLSPEVCDARMLFVQCTADYTIPSACKYGPHSTHMLTWSLSHPTIDPQAASSTMPLLVWTPPGPARTVRHPFGMSCLPPSWDAAT
mmetsp:Transcript_13546/g.37343  ORF Transcript_13546/g.37343 Transcript_13546/m.37343 type:complete len:90 (+) Transcript_13546:158-427(+)